MIHHDRLESLFRKFSLLHLIVIGDYFLDKYLVVDPALAEASLETGLEARQVVEIRNSPGAAGTVTNNLSALGIGRITSLGVIGDDGEGDDLIRGLRRTGVECAKLIRDSNRFTPTYIKSMSRDAVGERELERLDICNRKILTNDQENLLLEQLCILLNTNNHPIHGVIVADQVNERNHGVITDRVRTELGCIAQRYPHTCFFADSRMRIGEYRSMMVKPNLSEGRQAAGDKSKELTSEEIAQRINSQCGRTVYLTMGGSGIQVYNEFLSEIVPALPVTGPIDIVGAGDSTSSGIVSALAAGASPLEAAEIGVLCAAVTIGKLGTTGTASQAEILDAVGM